MGSKKDMYVRGPHYGTNPYVRQTRKPRRNTMRTWIFLAIILVAITAIVALFRYLPGLIGALTPGTTKPSQTTTATTTKGSGTTTSGESQTSQPTATPSPTPTVTPAAYNQLLLPETELARQAFGSPAEGTSPADRKIVSTIFDNLYNVLGAFNRADKIDLFNPLYYNKIPGVLTFRGNNFRNAAAFGLVSLKEKKFAQVWQQPVGSLPSSAWSFTWTGTGWTGQPLLVQWDKQVRNLMNIDPVKKTKENLVEVIYATMDGNIYFYDLDDGKPTRPPIKIGAPIKGTPCVDPRGYPVLYVGQGDKNSHVNGIGFRVFNLIDQSLLLYKECSDTHSYRDQWGACDSSPIFDAASDTLIYPNENGLIYTAKMNTKFDLAGGTLSINPVFTTYRYKMTGLTNFGAESSMSIYGQYGFFSDNSGILNCINLNTLKPVWSRQLEDDSDVTPVLNQDGKAVELYTATEVDWQQDIIGTYKGNSYIYKIDALTGKILWKASYPCYTKNAADNGDDINGGAMGTPVVGKKDLKDLVIYSFCMTKGLYSGNSLVAFNRSNGTLAWEYKMNSYSWSSPVDIYDDAGHGYIVMPDSAGQLHLVDGLTGKALDVIQLTKGDNKTAAGNIESSCALFGNRLVIGTRGNVIVGVDLK
jgi:outer membrane protein assembly factor BamB